MQHIDGVCQPNCVDSSVSTTLVVIDDLDNPGAAEATQWLRPRVHLTYLRQIERIAEDIFDTLRKLPKIVARRSDEIERSRIHRRQVYAIGIMM